jgi:predicted PurR-regulated permease PerM
MMMSAQLPDPVPGAQPQSRLSISITHRSLWQTAALVVAILALILLVSQALGTVILLVLAIILGEALRPVVERLKRYHIPPPIAILLIYGVVLAVMCLLIWLLVRPLVGEISSLIVQLPRLNQEVQALLVQLREQLHAQDALRQALQNLANSLTEQLQRSAPTLLVIPLRVLQGAFGIFIQVVVVLTMTLFWLLSSTSLKPFLLGLFPVDSRAKAACVLTGVSKAFSGYVYGTLVRMSVIGTLSGIGLAILQVPYALLLGVLTGVTELIPYIGPWISGSISVVLALVLVGPVKALEVAILFFLVFELEGNVVQPLVLSHTVHVDPLLVLVSVLVGITLLGIIGAVLAVPLAAGAQVVVVQVVAPAIRRAGSGDSAT